MPNFQLFSPNSTGLDSSSSRLQSEEHEVSSLNFDEERGISASAKDVVQRNIGLLLFITSQAIFTFINLAVKVLNTETCL